MNLVSTYDYSKLMDFIISDSYLASIIIFSKSLFNNLHEYPILIAVSILSPVNTQTFIVASFKV